MPCGICGQSGHNRVTCPKKETQLASASDKVATVEEEDLSASERDIFSYIENRQYKELTDAIIKGVDLNAVDDDGFTPIVLAILNHDLKAVTSILENATNERNKFDINKIVNPIQLIMERGSGEEHSGTPLMCALTEMLRPGNITDLENLEPIVLELLAHGADPNIHSQHVLYKRTDNTSLFVAVQTGVISVVRELISKGADVNDVSVHNGRRLTPLYAAGLAKRNVKDILLLLLQNGADQTQLVGGKTELDGKTALEHHKDMGGNIHSQHLAAIKELNSPHNGGGTMNPCIKGKRRNPKTKRCRKICTNGQRRNPKTKRCRK